MIRVIETERAIEVRSFLPNGLRIFFLLCSLFPVLAPYELIIRPAWQSYLNLFFLFAAVIAAGALAVSAFLIWAAIAGTDSVLRFDKADKTLTYSAGAPIVSWRTRAVGIDRVARVRVLRHDWSDGPPGYSVVVELTGGDTFRSGPSASKDEAEKAVQKVSAFLGLPALA